MMHVVGCLTGKHLWNQCGVCFGVSSLWLVWVKHVLGTVLPVGKATWEPVHPEVGAAPFPLWF